MSNLDNLISKIISDSEEKSRQIIDAANEKAIRMFKESIDLAETERMCILEDARREAQKASERIISVKKLEIRDNAINAKRGVIEVVLNKALERLNNMDKNNFWEWLCKYLLNLDLNGEEIILPDKYKIKNTNELNAYLKKNNKSGDLKLYNGTRKINGGFVLIKHGVEANYTFESLIDYYRYDLENIVIKTIF